MIKIKITLNKNYMIYLFLIIFSIYQNCPLGKYMGVYGEQPVFMVSLFLFLYLLVFKRQKIFKTIRPLFYLLFYLIGISIIANLIYVVINQDSIILGENIFYKSIKVCIIYFSYLSYMFCLVFYGKKLKRNMIFRPFYILLIIISLLAFVEKIQMPYGLSFIPSINSYPYYRIRLLSRESSFTSTLILLSSILGIYYSFRYPLSKVRIIISVFLSGFIIYISGSKALLGLFVIFGLLYSIKVLFKNIKAIWKLAYLILVVLLLCLILPRFFSMVSDDLTKYTSIVTRFYSIFNGFIIGIMFPFGFGCSLHLWAIPHFYLTNLALLSKFGINLNLSEIYSIIETNNDFAVSVKSGVLQYNMYWGIVGTIVLITCLYKMYRSYKKIPHNKDKKIITSLSLTLMIAVLLVRDFTSDFWIIISIINIFIEKHKILKNIGKEVVNDERNNIGGWKWNEIIPTNYCNK